MRHGRNQHRRARFDGLVSLQRLERFILWRPAHARQRKCPVLHATKGDHDAVVQLRRRGCLAQGRSLLKAVSHVLRRQWPWHALGILLASGVLYVCFREYWAGAPTYDGKDLSYWSKQF